jgi:hypothetical protein
MMETADRPRPAVFERHYTLAELAKSWHVDRKTLVEWFRGQPGVIKFGSEKPKEGRVRPHVSIRVPESVAGRVYKTRTGRV